MQQKDEKERKADHGCFHFRRHIESKENKQCGETSRFEEDGWNLKDQKRFESGNIKKAHKTS